MKKALVLLLLSTNLFASGKLVLNGNYFTLDSRLLPSVGFSSYEDTGLGFFVDSYIGTGIAPRHNYPDVYWWVARADLSLPVGEDLTVSVGATLRLSEQEWIGVEDESNLHCKLSYKLW